MRVFPLSNWTELDVWEYVRAENVPVVPLYFAKKRPIVGELFRESRRQHRAVSQLLWYRDEAGPAFVTSRPRVDRRGFRLRRSGAAARGLSPQPERRDVRTQIGVGAARNLAWFKKPKKRMVPPS